MTPKQKNLMEFVVSHMRDTRNVYVDAMRIMNISLDDAGLVFSNTNGKRVNIPGDKIVDVQVHCNTSRIKMIVTDSLYISHEIVVCS